MRGRIVGMNLHRGWRGFLRPYVQLVWVAAFQACSTHEEPAAQHAPLSACTVVDDRVLAVQAVGASWIPWESKCLPGARVVYVDRSDWDVWVMSESGDDQRCLTCYGNNEVGKNFPLDDDGSGFIHWKGDPEAFPNQPIILLKAENEYSEHRALRNSPSIGWNNDIWALNVCTRRYTRLIRFSNGEGTQHTAMSEDGAWYVYPLRTSDATRSAFGNVVMVFGTLHADASGDLAFTEKFRRAPLGALYYEPNDIREISPGQYALFYVAGSGTELDAYRFEWCPDGSCPEANVSLAQTRYTHEEFLMVSPQGKKLAWMQGSKVGLSYNADLFVSQLDFTEPEQITAYNDCTLWPDRCLRNGAQQSRMTWNGDGTSLYYGLWEHGERLPFLSAELHRLDFAGACGGKP